MWISDSSFYTETQRRVQNTCEPYVLLQGLWECHQVVPVGTFDTHLLPHECQDAWTTSAPLSSRPEALPKSTDANQMNTGHVASTCNGTFHTPEALGFQF